MDSINAHTTIHHLYATLGDLLPLCGAIPGPGDPGLGEAHYWHTGHDARVLHAHYDIGDDCCTPCLEYAVGHILDGTLADE